MPLYITAWPEIGTNTVISASHCERQQGEVESETAKRCCAQRPLTLDTERPMSQDASTKSSKSSKRKPLMAERLRELLHYDPPTGTWTRLKSRNNSNAKSGAIAGCVCKNGYKVICIDDRLYLGHRLAFLYMTGRWPVHEIDHKDGVPGHDWWENLREAQHIENTRNTRKRSDNTSGFKGVSWSTSDKKWRARIGKNSTFIGLFTTPEEAHAAYCKAAIARYGEFARFD